MRLNITLLLSLILLTPTPTYAETEAEARAIVDWPEVGLARADGASRNVYVYFPYKPRDLPEWLGGYTRLLAIQRRLIVDYVLDRRLATLKRALAVLPMFGTVQQLNPLAEALHGEYGLTT